MDTTSPGLNPGTSVGSCTISFTGFGSVSSVDLYCTHASGVLGNANLSINGTPVAGLANNDWATYDVTGSGLLGITIAQDGAGKSTTLRAVRVNGKIHRPWHAGRQGFYLPFSDALTSVLTTADRITTSGKTSSPLARVKTPSRTPR